MSELYTQAFIRYGRFWPRVGAAFLDMLVMLPVTLPLNIYNVTDWKSKTVILITSFLPLIYKIVMEYKFGATLGKMGLQLKVVDYDFNKPSFQNVFLRNIFTLVFTLISIATTVAVFNKEGFEDITGYSEYSQFTSENTSVATGLYYLSVCAFYLVDSSFLWSDERKRSLHDRVGQTYVVDRMSELVAMPEQSTDTNEVY